MCGRFTLRAPTAVLSEIFGIEPLPGLAPRYNIAPSQPVSVVAGENPRTWSQMRWGLVPFWAKDPAIGHRMINARGETVASKPAYRDSFRRRRCLIPADGFYEWRRLDVRRKQPFYLQLADAGPFAFAGLWDRWVDPATGTTLQSCALITTEPNETVAPIHDRMPVMLVPGQFEAWLDPGTAPAALRELLAPFDDASMSAYAVRAWVNNPAHDDPTCIAPLSHSAGRNRPPGCERP